MHKQKRNQIETRTLKQKGNNLIIAKMNKVAEKIIAKVGQAALYGISGYEIAQLTKNEEHEKIVVNIPTPKPSVSENKSDIDFGLISLCIMIAALFAGLIIFGLKVTRNAPVNLNLT